MKSPPALPFPSDRTRPYPHRADRRTRQIRPARERRIGYEQAPIDAGLPVYPALIKTLSAQSDLTYSYSPVLL